MSSPAALGANFLGIGASTEYRRDNVSVFLRAVSVMTGEVLVSITTDKTIYSVGVQRDRPAATSASTGFSQIEGGVTTNEPRQLAVRQAIEKAVHAMMLEGAERSYWAFADESRGQELIREYQAYRDEGLPSQPSGPVTATAPATPEPTPAAPPLAPRAEISSPAASPVVLAAAGGERALRPPSIGSPPDATNSGVRTDLRGRVLTTQRIIRVSIGDL